MALDKDYWANERISYNTNYCINPEISKAISLLTWKKNCDSPDRMVQLGSRLIPWCMISIANATTWYQKNSLCASNRSDLELYAMTIGRLVICIRLANPSLVCEPVAQISHIFGDKANMPFRVSAYRKAIYRYTYQGNIGGSIFLVTHVKPLGRQTTPETCIVRAIFTDRNDLSNTAQNPES
jgi:hypothetical protein